MKAIPLMRYWADLVPVFFTLLTAGLMLVPFGIEFSLLDLVAWSFLTLLTRAITPLHAHNHGHLKTFTSKPVNDIYEVILAFVTGFTTSGWELHHNLGHHANLTKPSDDVISPKRFHCEAGTWQAQLKFSVVGDFHAYADCLRIARGIQKRGNSRPLKRFLLQLAIQLVVLAALLSFDWLATLVVVIIPSVLCRWGVFWGAYHHHLHTDVNSLYTACNDIHKQPYILLNLGHHTAHHERPTLHWSLLPSRTKELQHEGLI